MLGFLILEIMIDVSDLVIFSVKTFGKCRKYDLYD